MRAIGRWQPPRSEDYHAGRQRSFSNFRSGECSSSSDDRKTRVLSRQRAARIASSFSDDPARFPLLQACTAPVGGSGAIPGADTDGMKTDLSEMEFRQRVAARARRFETSEFDEAAFPNQDPGIGAAGAAEPSSP